jgi:hypothetical protein
MQIKIQNQLLMNSGTIVSEQPSCRDGYRCWVAISAALISYLNKTPDNVLHINNLNRRLIPEDAKQIYTVRKVYVDAECIENDWDLDESIMDFFDVCYSFEAVLDFLKSRGIDDNGFSEPWNTDYPL